MDAITKYITDAHMRRFEWGTFDCFLFAAGATEIVIGEAIVSEVPKYRDEVTAEVMLREEFGTTNLREVFLKCVETYEGKRIEMHEAQNGDIACVQFQTVFQHADKIDQSCGLGVWHEGKVYVLTPAGIMQVPAGHRIMDVWSFR